MQRKKKEPIKVLNAVIIDNRVKDPEHWFVTFKYDGIRVDISTVDATVLYERFKRALEISSPEHKEIEMKLWFSEEKLLLKRTDIYAMYIKLKQMFHLLY